MFQAGVNDFTCAAAAANPAGSFLDSRRARDPRSGLNLTTAEVAWVLRVKPARSPITCGRITATRTGWQC